MTFVSLAASAAGCMDGVTEHRVRGNAHFREKDFVGAIAEYDEGLKTRPNDAATLILKGNALYELGRLDDAYDAFAKAYAADPKAADAIRGMAMIATTRSDLPDAATQFERMLGLPEHEHDSATRINLAKVDLALGKLDVAEQQAVEAAHENGNDEAVLFTLGRVYVAEGKIDEANSTFSHLIEVAPGKPSGPYGLALVSAKQGDKAGVIAHVGEAMSKGMKDEDAQLIAKDKAFVAYKDDPAFLAATTKK